jgi:hypothetical protein
MKRNVKGKVTYLSAEALQGEGIIMSCGDKYKVSYS